MSTRVLLIHTVGTRGPAVWDQFEVLQKVPWVCSNPSCSPSALTTPISPCCTHQVFCSASEAKLKCYHLPQEGFFIFILSAPFTHHGANSHHTHKRKSCVRRTELGTQRPTIFSDQLTSGEGECSNKQWCLFFPSPASRSSNIKSCLSVTLGPSHAANNFNPRHAHPHTQ